MVDLSDVLKDAFKKWGIRIFVLISLLFQVLQVLFASGRKRNTAKAFIFFTWSIYLLADWVAGFTLGLLCNSQGGSNCDVIPKGNNTMVNMAVVNKVPLVSSSKHKLCHNYNGDLLAFWAPFLLLHLGGPDTITAFSMEDNSLWPRHLVGLLFEVGAVVYVVLLSLPHNKLLAPTVLMFLAGIIKYSERTYALYCADLDVFRDSFLTQKTVVPNLPKDIQAPKGMLKISKMVESAHELFMNFKGIIVDQRSFESNDSLLPFLNRIVSSEAFQLVEYELSFIYDVLFTKAAIVHTCVGYLVRFLCTSLIMAASVLFILSNKHDFTSLDVLITYILLGGAIFLDMFAHIMLILSKWTIVRLKELETRFNFSAPLIIYHIISKVVSTSSEWSESMMQHSLVKTCLPHHGSSHLSRIVGTIERSFRVDLKLFDKLENTWSEPITDDLKEFIFQRLKDKQTELFHLSMDRNEQFLDESVKRSESRGILSLEKYEMDQLRYSVDECRFEKSILMWHIATDIFYHTDEGYDNGDKERSRHISNYIMYLLFMRLSMVPSITNWHFMYWQTRTHLEEVFSEWLRNNTPEANTIFTQQTLNQQLSDACNHLLSLSRETVEGKDESVLLEALDLAMMLNEKMAVRRRWELVIEIWTEMLQYAANKCPGIAHAQAVSRGGELLTFVGFLASHFDFQKSTTHPRDYFWKWEED